MAEVACHVACSADCIHSVTELVVPGSRGCGRPRKTWREYVKRYIMECGLYNSDPKDTAVWRAGIRASRLLLTPVTGSVAAI